MGAIQGYLEKLGGNFMVAAFIPSLAFVTAGSIVFGPLIPVAVIQRAEIFLSPLGESGLIVLLLAIMMGFTLTSLNTYIYKLFEGYVFPSALKPFRKLEIKRARQLRSERDQLNKKIQRLEAQQSLWKRAKMPRYDPRRSAKNELKIQLLKNQRDALAAIYDLRYPQEERLILPTRLGNILRASESYSQDRYLIDSVAFWPRMVHVIDKDYMGLIDTANDQCSFLLNSSLLSGIFSVLSFLASFYQLFLFYLFFYHINIANNLAGQIGPEYQALNIFAYMVLGVLCLGIAWFFYTASLLNVSKYGNLIRSSFDLFRFNLLEKLHLPLPPHNEKEKELWERLSEFITIGELYGNQRFDYPAHGADPDEELEAQADALSIEDDLYNATNA